MNDQYVIHLEHDVPLESDQGHVVPEVGGAVGGVHVLGLQPEVLVRQPLRLLPHIPLAQPDLHPVDLGAERFTYLGCSDDKFNISSYLYTQWAAVRTHLSLMSAPPQEILLDSRLSLIMAA